MLYSICPEHARCTILHGRTKGKREALTSCSQHITQTTSTWPCFVFHESMNEHKNIWKTFKCICLIANLQRSKYRPFLYKMLTSFCCIGRMLNTRMQTTHKYPLTNMLRDAPAPAPMTNINEFSQSFGVPHMHAENYKHRSLCQLTGGRTYVMRI